ncbi:MAG: ABC transporter transmembrane domain-containing protein, partial [Actinomycetota bacterium]|nr:ABC transporter transmembrane domain-containing protein [Actinomycetota bacterium]
MLIDLLRRYLKPYKREIAIIVGLQLVGTLAALTLPSLNADIIDKGVLQGDTGYILRMGGWMLAVSLVQVVVTITAIYFGARTAMAFGRDVRSAFFHRVLEFSGREMARFGAPSLLTRNTNDVQQVQMLVLMTFTMLVTAPIMMVGGVFMALREDVGLSWLILALVPILSLVIWFILSH